MIRESGDDVKPNKLEYPIMSKHFWDHLLATASVIEGLADAQDGDLNEISGHMESIEVLYRRTFDPADAYEEYVAVTLCCAINKALPELAKQSLCCRR